MDTSIVQYIDVRPEDSSKVKGCLEDPKHCRSLVVNGDQTPSLLTIKAQYVHSDCGIFVVKYTEYIFQNKINKMPKKFDTRAGRYNMAVQLFMYAIEKPDQRFPASA
ncbi:Papain-like cysteine peptidase superfamily [Forsythia ovata]|uniref:Papain-like cysteine peptidase superfamily n=1 Tax=Forsythia ovata TaxID=205694 RepID=A0ABD1U860_9LAMI